MKRIAAITLLMLCRIPAFSQLTTPADSLALQQAVTDAVSKREIADNAKAAAKAASDSAVLLYKHWQAVPKTDPDTAGAKKLIYETKQADSLRTALAFAKADGAATIAESIRRNLYRNAFGIYPTENGRQVGKALIIIVVLLTLGITLLLTRMLRRFNFMEALSENVNGKIIVSNPEYSAEKIRQWMTEMNAGNINELEEALSKAKTALTEAQAANPQTDGQPAAQAVKDAQAEFSKAGDALRLARSSGSLNPMALASLGNLFPATIEVSGVGQLELAYRKIEELQSRLSETKETIRQAEAGKNEEAHSSALRLQEDLSALLKENRKKVENLKALTTADYRPSVSRLIALISALLLFVVGLAATCFFLYFYLVNGVAPNLSNLSAVLIALGIGMAPYAVNKVANASTDKNKTI